MSLSPLGHLADRVMTSTTLPYLLTILLDGYWYIPVISLAVVHLSLVLGFGLGGPSFADGIGNEPDEAYVFGFVLPAIGGAFALLGWLNRWLFRIPMVIKLFRCCWGAKRRAKRRATTPSRLYQVTFIIFILLVTVLPDLIYQFMAPRDLPSSDPLLGFILVLVVKAVAWGLGYPFFRFVVRSRAVYGTHLSSDGKSRLDVNNFNRIWLWMAVPDYIITLMIAIPNYIINDINALWIAALIAGVIVLGIALAYYFLLRPTPTTERIVLEDDGDENLLPVPPNDGDVNERDLQYRVAARLNIRDDGRPTALSGPRPQPFNHLPATLKLASNTQGARRAAAPVSDRTVTHFMKQ